MQNFTAAYMNGWTYVRIVRTILSEPKFFECIAKQIFLLMELRFDYYYNNQFWISFLNQSAKPADRKGYFLPFHDI